MRLLIGTMWPRSSLTGSCSVAAQRPSLRRMLMCFSCWLGSKISTPADCCREGQGRSWHEQHPLISWCCLSCPLKSMRCWSRLPSSCPGSSALGACLVGGQELCHTLLLPLLLGGSIEHSCMVGSCGSPFSTSLGRVWLWWFR